MLKRRNLGRLGDDRLDLASARQSGRGDSTGALPRRGRGGSTMAFAVVAIVAFAGTGLATFAGLRVRPTTIEFGALVPMFASGNCHPSYRGACLPPNGPDVDCVGQDGNGPLFVTGPLQVVGPDVYGLDADNDGVACEYAGSRAATDTPPGVISRTDTALHD